MLRAGYMTLRPLKMTFLACAMIGLPTSCSAPADDHAEAGDEADLTQKASLAQMNDVSVLYPLPTTAAEFDGGYVAAGDHGKGGQVLPLDLYTSLTHQPKSSKGNMGGYAIMAWDDLRVVGFRIDPCFANIGPVTDASSCVNQLRLIFQPISTFAWGSNFSAQAFDGAVHAFYQLTRAQLVELVRGMIVLRQKESRTASLGPLAVHPTLKEQGVLGDAGQAMKQLLLKYAGAGSLTRLTTFIHFAPKDTTHPDADSSWTFAGFDIANKKGTPMILPTLPGSATSEMFDQPGQGSLVGSFSPATTSNDDLHLLANLTDAQSSTKEAQQAAFDAALRIQNPDVHSANTIDCASCHAADVATVLTGGALGLSMAGNANAFVPDKKYVSATALERTTPVSVATIGNLHAFSYVGTAPMISLRVINETASVITYLNGQVLAGASD